MIYFLLCEQIKILKIGYTKYCNFYLSGRASAAYKQVPEIPILVGVMNGGLKEEAKLHKYYDELRVHRIYRTGKTNFYNHSPISIFRGFDYEWFLYKDKLLDMYTDWPIAKVDYVETYINRYESKFNYKGVSKKDRQIIKQIIEEPIIENAIKQKNSSHLPSLIVQNEKIYE